MQSSKQAPHPSGPTPSATRPPVVADDGGLGFKSIVGEVTPANELLRLIAERIRVAAESLGLTREDLFRIFSRHSVFEGEGTAPNVGAECGFILVETHHLIHGKVGKGALKLVFPADLLGQGPQFQSAGPNVVEVLPPMGVARWEKPEDAEALVKQAMREFMTGESLSMSLKSQATGAPFAGSEGLLLCAHREFRPEDGRYLLHPALEGTEEAGRADKRRIESMMNQAAEMLTRHNRIAHDKIVHAAETNSTLTARLDLQLPVSVAEGHLRALLQDHPSLVIGDDDMTARLRELLARKDYEPSACVLARAAARMQMEHSLLLPASRAKLRRLLAELPEQGAINATKYRELIDLFFGTGEVQQNEDQLYHRREPILKALSVAFSTRSLDDCGEAEVLDLYLRTLLDNQRIMVESALLRRLPRGQSLPVDWFERAPLLSADHERRMSALVPTPRQTRDKVKESFWEIVNLLCEAKAEIPRYTPDPFQQARRDVLEGATRAITSAADLLPPVERIQFFTLPFTYECVTPKLGVVTRKPVDVCGSELRPEAMAAGGVMSVEILLQRLTKQTQPLKGVTVAIEGLGNAGKHVAKTMAQKGATIAGVSDSRGAIVAPGGFSREELAVIIAHKNSGRRLDTLLSSPAAQGLSPREGAGITFYPEPERLKQIGADILVLAAIPGSIRVENVADLKVRIVCELTGAAVTGEAKRRLSERNIHVIPDNLASSGGLLVSLSEMLQNSAGQNWDRKLEEYNLFEQLSASYDTVLKAADRYRVDAPTASDIVALERMHDLALYREALEQLAERVAERIRSLPVNRRMLVVADDDEDGVASAAVLHALVAQLNPGAERRMVFLNESFRSGRVVAWAEEAASSPQPFGQVFALDRSLPFRDPGSANLARVAALCPVTFINNHRLPSWRQDGQDAREITAAAQRTLELLRDGLLLVSPDTLRSKVAPKELSSVMILREIAQTLVQDEAVLGRIHWQAAVGSCLDVPSEPSNEWSWFFTQFNPDRTYEAARAIRMVTRAGGFTNAVQAMAGVERPDQLETNAAWGQFMDEFRLLEERVQLLVEKIVLENRRRPFTAHFFTHEEVASPTPVAGDELNELDFYHWISEHLTQRGNLGDKPIIVGQVVRDAEGRARLGVRIRSPRGVDLAEVGLPEPFKSGGLPNTAVARFSLDPKAHAPTEFQRLVDEIWMRTTSRIYLGSATGDHDGGTEPTESATH